METGKKRIYKKLFWLYSAFLGLLVLILMLPTILGAISVHSSTNNIPKEGVWYCRELEIVLNANDKTGYVIEQGEKVPCKWTHERNSNTITIKTSIEDLNSYNSGRIVANLRCKSLEADVLSAIGENNEMYQFIRSETIHFE